MISFVPQAALRNVQVEPNAIDDFRHGGLDLSPVVNSLATEWHVRPTT